MKTLSSVIRWLARILSLVMVVLVIQYAIRQGTFNPMGLLPEDRGTYLAMILMMVAGLLAWKWELVSGLVILAGFGAHGYFTGSWNERSLVIFPLAGCLYLIAWLLEHKPGVAPAKTSASSKSVRKRGRRARKRERRAANNKA